MKISNNASPSFGWNIKTHYRLTKLAASQFPNLRASSNLLAFSSMMPDIKLSQTSFGFRDAHCFFGKDFYSMDIVPRNASDFYCDLLSKSLNYMSSGKNLFTNYMSMKKAGNALHFLQDVAVPIHVKKEARKPSKIFAHIKYENIAKNNPEWIDDISHRTKSTKPATFKECFMDTYKKSSSMENPFEIPAEKWGTSVQTSLANAYEHTLQFLSKISMLKEAPASKQANAFVEELIEDFSQRTGRKIFR